MAKYYVKFESGVNWKNLAQREAFEYVKQQDGILLLREYSKDEFLKELKREIDKINRHYRRCGDVRFSTWKTESAENVSIGEGVCVLRIYPVKLEIE